MKLYIYGVMYSRMNQVQIVEDKICEKDLKFV